MLSVVPRKLATSCVGNLSIHQSETYSRPSASQDCFILFLYSMASFASDGLLTNRFIHQSVKDHE